MGNRAVIATENKDIELYLHWNGGRDSVEAFLTYCRLKQYRSPETDGYGWARLAQVIGNFFGGTSSVGLHPYEHPSAKGCDNGRYIIKDWKIIGREFFDGPEQNEYELSEMLQDIDARMPKDEQLGEFLTAKEVPISSLKVGDVVWFDQGLGRGYTPRKVVGFGDESLVNGIRRLGIPYVNLYFNYGSYKWNPNNYLHGDTIRVVSNPL